ACLLSPSFLSAFSLPPELGWLGPARLLTSPFQTAYWTSLGRTPAGFAYYPLLGLGLVSFLANHAHWRWQRFLPWLGLAVLSAFQARAVPFFAVLGGPVLAWNLQE